MIRLSNINVKYKKEEVIDKLQSKKGAATGSYNDNKKLCTLNGMKLFNVIPKVVEGRQGKA